MKKIRVANAQGFWGDSPGAVSQLLTKEAQVDYITLDYLAEVSLSIMAIQRDKDASLGYARDFLQVVESCLHHWREGGQVRLVTNGGGLNPKGCAEAIQSLLKESGCSLKVGVVTGDGVLHSMKERSEEKLFCHSETGSSLRVVGDKLVTANAYIGAESVSEALALGAQIVVTGRVADPSLVVGCCTHAFGWKEGAWDALAGATVAGHLIECGTQVCGGIATHWLEVEEPEGMGFPIVEIEESGSCVVTKSPGTGGEVSERTVKEQLLYEIGDPQGYLSPDATVDFTGVTVAQQGKDRVRVEGAKGSPPPSTYKVSATYRAGFRSEGTLVVVGHQAEKKARQAGEVILKKLARAGVHFERSIVEILGSGDVVGQKLSLPQGLQEVVLRIAVADGERKKLERFGREIAPMVTSGPAGTTGYTSGRPKPRPVFGYWPCLIERENVDVQVELI